MELWIRNQDRENLVKVELLEINKREKDFMIITIFQNKVAHLGIYKTKERALEILDEIQDTIKQQEFVKLTFNKIPVEQYENNEDKINKMFSYFVYEMPNE